MRNFNEEIKKYPIYRVRYGIIERYYYIESIADYDHSTMQLHHFIKDYERNKKWYDEKEIKQKLFLVPIEMHEQIHNRAIKNMSDKEFKECYGVSRWELLFNRKFSKY